MTAAQEAILEQIIEAFQNGKRLSDLPDVSGTNPFNLICEVLEEGESKKAALATLLPYMEEECSYGIQWDTTVSTPACTRIGNLSLHKRLPIQNRMRGCLLSDHGTVAEYLNPTNWKAHALDGSRGQVMVEIPAHYRKFETEGAIRRCKISEYPLPGYHAVPQMYISAYEAAMERSTGKLCSVVNAGPDYRGGNNQSDWDGTYRSLLGRPVTAKSRSALRSAARLRNASATSEWNCLDYNAYKALFWLYYTEYADRNCQTAFNAQKDTNGFAQGGLGDGVTTWNWSEWNDFNGNNPFVPCGCTDALGNASGEIEYMQESADGQTKKFMVPRYRGIENPFGHIWNLTDGINIQIASEANGGTSSVYVADNPANYSDSQYNGYTFRGLEARTESYVKELVFGEFGDLLPAVVGGGSTTYWTDYHYTLIPSSGTEFHGVLLGGAAHYGASAGFACAHTLSSPSIAAAYIGSRLCFIPNNTPQ